MRIEHCGLLSWVHERTDAQKSKNHAQDGRTLIGSGDQRPAILPWFSIFGWRPSLSQVTGTLPVRPSGRIAAGLQFEHDPFGKSGLSPFRIVLLRMSSLLRERRKTPVFAASCKTAR
jgi:hypothetical protein